MWNGVFIYVHKAMQMPSNTFITQKRMWVCFRINSTSSTCWTNQDSKVISKQLVTKTFKLERNFIFKNCVIETISTPPQYFTLFDWLEKRQVHMFSTMWHHLFQYDVFVLYLWLNILQKNVWSENTIKIVSLYL